MTKTFRVFLSSTFGDFQIEREALKNRVWPPLENHCRSRGAAFEVVDLRWGVSEADMLSHDTLRICLDEVAACQNLSPRPNFIMLIGNRYGWRPLPAEIPVGEFEMFLAIVPNADDQAILQSWYKQDDNAVPPHYRLLPRGGEYQTGDEWTKIEYRLTQLLRNAAMEVGLTRERRERYFLSATHLEIAKGSLSVIDAYDHVFSFFRDIDGLNPAQPIAVRFTDLRDDEPDQEALTLRNELRQEIRDVLPASHCFHYHCTWTNDPVAPLSTAHIDSFCADVERALLEQIDRELQSPSGDALEQEIARHAQFAAEHTQGFIGRDVELAELMDWADAALKPESSEAGAPPIIVHAPGGSGKSSFMALGAARIAARYPEAVIITRFVGATPNSIELISFLRGLLREMARRYDRPDDLPEGGLKELIDALHERLAWASPEKPLLLAIDALDQFAPSLETREHRWLPVQVPTCAALMLSVLDGPVQEAVGRRYQEAIRVKLPAFTRSEGGTLLDNLLLTGEAVAPGRKRRLTSEQKQAVLDAFAHDGRPLYLALAAGLVRRWRSWDAPAHLPKSIEALVEEIVKRLRAIHGEHIADRALDYLCASRFGLSDAEICELLWRDPEAKNEFDVRKNADQPAVSSLPPVIWSRIHSELSPWLAAQNIGGNLLHRFFHRILGEEIGRVSLADDAIVAHQRLADYFGGQPLRLSAGNGRQPNLRRLMEQPWQLTKAGQLKEAEALLTDFDFAMAKCEANLVEDLFEDYSGLLNAQEDHGTPQSPRLKEWASFMQRNAHLLRRGSELWPSHKILLQIAVEEADNSALTQAAESWLQEGHCDWVWMRRRRRPATKPHDHLLAVMEGHTSSIYGALILPDGRILSWSNDHVLRLWDGRTGAALAVMEGHTKWIVDVQVLPNSRILSWAEDGTLRLWDGPSGAALAVMEGHTDRINGALILRDGRILSWSEDCTLRLWDGHTGRALAVMDAHASSINGALVHTDGRILSWSGDNSLFVWDSQSGTVLTVMKDHTASVWSAWVMPNGGILSCSCDNTLRLWDVQSGATLALMQGHAELINGALVLPNGRILSWSRDRTLRLWDGQSGAMLAVMEGHTASITDALLVPKHRILSWSMTESSDELDHTLRLWDGQSGAALVVMEGHTDRINGALVLPDGRILSWSDDGTLRVWDEQSGAALVVMEGHTDRISGALALPDGRILSWSDDGTLRLWDGRSEAALAAMEGHTDRIYGALIHSDGRILSWSADDKLCLWDTQSGVEPVLREGHTKRINGTLLLSDGQILSWSEDKTLRLWDGHSGKVLTTMKGHSQSISNALALPASRILSWSSDNTLRLWDGQSGATLAVMEGHTDSINNALILSNGRILSWSEESDYTLRMWDERTGAALAVLDRHTDRINGAMELPGGRILSWSADDSLRLWNGQTGAELAVMRGHTNSVTGARLLPDGRIMSFSRDNTLRIWDAQSGAAQVVMKGHTSLICDAAVLPDGRILSWSYDATLRLWNGQSGETLAVMAGHTEWVTDAFLLPDGRILSTTSSEEDLTLRLWDGQSGVALAVIAGHTESVFWTAVLSDGKILSRIGDNTLHLWDGQSGACLLTHRSHWLEDPLFSLWEELPNNVGGKSRVGNVWVESDNVAQIRLTDRIAGWQTHWHGDAPQFREYVAGSWIVSSGQHLQFLCLMRGSEALES